MRLSALWKKYGSVLSYLFFGVLTTGVNFLVYFPCYNLLFFSSTVSNGIAWVVSVAFAYVTNKPFVFHSNDWSLKTVMQELAGFVSTRAASGILETAVLFVAVDMLGMDGNVWKIATGVLVIVLNYLGSKFLVFRSSKEE